MIEYIECTKRKKYKTLDTLMVIDSLRLLSTFKQRLRNDIPRVVYDLKRSLVSAGFVLLAVVKILNS